MKNNSHFTYKSIAHAKTRLRYHIIFCTKYRCKCLNTIRDVVLDSFRYAESKSDFRILNMEVDEDHIHFLIKFKPSLSIEQVVRRMKQLSTKYLFEHEHDYLKKHYWKHNKIWTGGYFCSTIGEVSENKLKTYIENQG